MANLSEETEAFAQRLAAAQSRKIDDTIRLMLEDKARAVGVRTKPQRRRVDAMLAGGADMATMPACDPRSPRDIADEADTIGSS